MAQLFKASAQIEIDVYQITRIEREKNGQNTTTGSRGNTTFFS